jgi:hypothetical protein
MTWQMDQSLMPMMMVPEEKTGNPYIGMCVECLLRAEGVENCHDVLALSLKGQHHKAWFWANRLKNLEYDGALSHWSREEIDGSTYLKLTIAADEHEPETKIYVWRLTDEAVDGSFMPHYGDRVLGVWPD